jgi:hypothetical protein
MATSNVAAMKPFPFTEAHPQFCVPGWRELLGKDESVSASNMVRHFLVTGETGSGKSASAVMRLLEAILRYPDAAGYEAYKATVGVAAEARADLRPAALVVDPKQELQELVEREAGGRKVTRVTYGEPGPVLYFFEGRDLSALDAFEVVDYILMLSEFYVQDQARSREPMWNLQAASILKDFVSIDMWLAHRGIDQVRQLWDKTRTRMAEYSDFAPVLGNVCYDPVNYFKSMSTILGLSGAQEGSAPLACYLDSCAELSVPGDLTVRLVALASLYYSTRSGVIFMVNGILADIAADEFAACVSLNPLEPPPAKKMLSVKRSIERGDVVVYIPTPTVSPIADTVGRCLKSKFFEFAFQRSNKVRPFFYVVDEAQRFLTAGEQDGEQSLLDRCRAYRTGVVLSSQSIASMAHRLEGAMGGGYNALQIMLNNCGNALYFRTSDIQTQDNLRQRIPDPPVPDRPHVIKVRPLATLPVGSCYALRANGSWGLFNVHLPG